MVETTSFSLNERFRRENGRVTDLIIRNARIFGTESTEPVDIAISDGVIAAFGAELDARGAREIDAAGRTLIPGLWDEHVHTNQWAISRRRLDLTGAQSAAEAVALVAEAIDASTDDVFVGVNYRDPLWPDTPTAAALDAVSGDRPVMLVSGDVHGTWLNSAAIARFGVTEHNDGLISEYEAFRVQQLANFVDDTTLDAWVADSLADAASRGIVGLVDFEMRDSAPDWIRRSAAGQVPIRIEASVYSQDLDTAIAEQRSTGRVLDHTGRVTAGYFKVITDGSLGTRTAWCSHAYPDGSHGAANIDYAELEQQVAQAHAAGIAPAIHAIGDLANAAVLNMYERLGFGGRLEHAQQVAPADVARFAALGVIASIQPEHAMDDRDAAEQLWADALEDSYLLKSLVDAGATIALGSDAPVAPLDPWFAIASAVFRSRDGREPWRDQEALTLEQAIAASTRYARIEVGTPADLVLLDADPCTANVDALRALPVALTLVAGETAFSNL